MKVTLVVGGRWHAFDLAKVLNENGHLHRIITNYPRWFVKRWGIPSKKIVSLPMTFFAVKAIYKIGGEALMMRCQWFVHQWFAERAAKHLNGSEIIHGWSQWSEQSLKWAKGQGVPTVLERSSAHILEQSRLLREEHKREGIKWTPTHYKVEEMELREYELCRSIAVPSIFVENSFLERGFEKNKIFRNRLGVSLTCFRPLASAPESPLEIGLKIIYAGSLSVRKGISDLLSGFILADMPNATLTLLGGWTPELKPLVLKQPDSVKALGHLPQESLVSHYQQSHCFVIASIEEGMAMVQMQALACGLPLICTTNTGGEDLLRLSGNDGKQESLGVIEYPAGFVVPIHSPQAISYCLRRLGSEPALWLQMRQEAIRLSTQELSWNGYGERAIEHYRMLLS